MPTVVGAPIRLTTTFTNSAGTLVDPTTVSLYLTDPTGVAVVGSPFAAVRDSVGVYHYDYTPSVSGIFQWYFAGTGSVNLATQVPDVFTVAGTTTGALISLADAKEALNKTSTAVNPTSTDDAELMKMIRSATTVVNHVCGYTVATSQFDFVSIGWGQLDPNGPYVSGYVPIVVTKSPVISVQSIQPQFYNAAAADISKLVIDSEAGIVWLPASGMFLGPCLITYTAGRTTVPTVLQEACQIIVQHLWQLQRGPVSQPSMAGDDLVIVPGVGYAIPSRAVELMTMSPYKAAPGFA